MDNPVSPGKRKRPTYIPDDMYSDSESEDESRPKKNKKRATNTVSFIKEFKVLGRIFIFITYL